MCKEYGIVQRPVKINIPFNHMPKQFYLELSLSLGHRHSHLYRSESARFSITYFFFHCVPLYILIASCLILSLKSTTLPYTYVGSMTRIDALLITCRWSRIIRGWINVMYILIAIQSLQNIRNNDLFSIFFSLRNINATFVSLDTETRISVIISYVIVQHIWYTVSWRLSWRERHIGTLWMAYIETHLLRPIEVDAFQHALSVCFDSQ